MEEKFVIKSEDWKSLKYQAFRNEQLTLAILKDKGAPVKGNLFFTPDMDNYEWKREKKENEEIFYIKTKGIQL